MLRRVGHDVRTCYSSQTALRLAAEFKPEAILLDIGLPEMDGYEVARRLRRDPLLGNVLLIALTGYGQESDQQRSLEAGFNAHLVKPIDLAKIHQLLSVAANSQG